MTDFFSKTFYGNTVSDWAISFTIILAVIIISKLLYLIIGKIIKSITKKTKTKLDDLLVDMLEEPILVILTVSGIWFAATRLHFSDAIDGGLNNAFYFAIAVTITWLIARVVDALIQEYVVPLADKSESDLDDHLIPIIRKSLKSLIWVLGVIVALNNIGFDVGALLAGLGIGGLALAMAAKDTVSNIFGGLSVFVDKPFKLNDRIKIDSYDGTIIDIGLRSTRLKTLEGRIVTIPNHKFTGGYVENVSLEPSRKVVLNLGLTYDTNEERINKAIEILKDISGQSKNLEGNTLISFNAFGDFSLGILFIYYIKKSSNILETQTEINLEILKQFNAEKLEFAFPTQTIYSEKQ